MTFSYNGKEEGTLMIDSYKGIKGVGKVYIGEYKLAKDKEKKMSSDTFIERKIKPIYKKADIYKKKITYKETNPLKKIFKKSGKIPKIKVSEGDNIKLFKEEW